MSDPKLPDWQPCPPGELARLSAWMKFRKQLWTAVTIGGVAIGATAGTAATVWGVRALWPDSNAPPAKKHRQPNHPPNGERADFGGPRGKADAK